MEAALGGGAEANGVPIGLGLGLGPDAGPSKAEDEPAMTLTSTF